MRMLQLRYCAIFLFLVSCGNSNSDISTTTATKDFCTEHALIKETIAAFYHTSQIDCRADGGKISYFIAVDSSEIKGFFQPDFMASMTALYTATAAMEFESPLDSVVIDLEIEGDSYGITYKVDLLKFVLDAQEIILQFAYNLKDEKYENALNLVDNDLLLEEGNEVVFNFIKGLNPDHALVDYQVVGFQSQNGLVAVYVALIFEDKRIETISGNFMLPVSNKIRGFGFLNL